MSSFRILITGASGFVGRHLVMAIQELGGHEVVICDHSFDNADGRPSATKSIPLDVTNAAQVHAVIQSQRPTHVVHLAAITAPSVAQRDIRKTWNVNLGGTLNMALAVTEAAPNCRFIFCSSAEVYGASFHDGRPLDEKALLEPASVYGASKAAADLLVGQMALEGLKAVRLRPFNHTGPGQSEQFAVPSFAAQIARSERGEQEPVIRVGNLCSRKDFLDVRDIVRAYIAVILRFDELPIGAVFNIASGRTVSMGEILDQLISFASRKILVSQDPTRLRQGEAFTASGNADAFRRVLSWQPQVELSSTLSSVLGYFRNQRRS